MTKSVTNPVSQMRDAIIAHLRGAGSDSISGVARALSTVGGAPVHRLSIAGYLAALTDEGILREVERPPSKHYQLAERGRHRTLWERAGSAVSALHIPAPDRATAVVACLEHLLARPVFLAELQAAGFPEPGQGVEQVTASDEDRRMLRHLLREDGPHPLAVPRGDPLLQARTGAISDSTVRAMVRHVALDAAESDALANPAPATRGVQARLSLGEPS